MIQKYMILSWYAAVNVLSFHLVKRISDAEVSQYFTTPVQ